MNLLESNNSKIERMSTKFGSARALAKRLRYERNDEGNIFRYFRGVP